MSHQRQHYQQRAVSDSGYHNRQDEFVTIPRNVYDKLVNSYSPAASVYNQHYDDPYYDPRYEQDSHEYSYNHGSFASSRLAQYSVDPYRPPQQTDRPKNAGSVSSTLYFRNASTFFREEIRNIDERYFNVRLQTGKTVIIDCNVLFGRYYMKGNEVLGNKTEELIRDMSLLWLHHTGFIIVEVSSGWRDDHADKSIKYLVGYKTRKGKDPVRMTRSEMDDYMLGHPLWEEQKKNNIYQY